MMHGMNAWHVVSWKNKYYMYVRINVLILTLVRTLLVLYAPAYSLSIHFK